MDIIELFVYTITEYKKFFSKLNHKDLLDEYSKDDYTKVNVKLMLLRKYGNRTDKVYIGKVIEKSMLKYADRKNDFEKILKEYDEIEKSQLELILSDGTKLNLYNTIEDVMYGLYLHADEERINRLKKTDEGLRFVCVRKYVEELEKIVYQLYELLESCKKIDKEKITKEKASVIYLGDKQKNVQNIKNTPYWSNLYGRDGTESDIQKILNNYESEEFEIQFKCLFFLELLKMENINKEALDLLILPESKSAWGDYEEASCFLKSIKNPGVSTMVRYNDNHSEAYVRIFPNVDDVFIIDTPHILSEISEIILVNKNGWKICSIKTYSDEN